MDQPPRKAAVRTERPRPAAVKDAPGRPDWRFILSSAAVLLVVILVAYGGALRNGFVADDQYLITARLPYYLDEFSVGKAFTQTFWKGNAFGVPRPGEDVKDYYRPLVTVSYALDAKVWRERPFGYHLTNLLLHALASGLVLLLLRQIGLRRSIALPAAILFALHPIHVTNVAWIAGRTDLLAAVFLLGGMVAIGRHLDRAAEVRSFSTDRLRSPDLWLALLAYLLALFSKEMAVTFGGLVFLRTLLRRRQADPDQRPPSWPWLELALIALVTIGTVVFRAMILGLPDFRAGARTDVLPFRFGAFPTAYSYYWRVLTFPGTLHFYVPLRVPASAEAPLFLLNLLLLLLSIAAAVILIRRIPIAGLGAAWLLVSLLPVSQLLPLAFRAIVAEYWSYIPSIGFVALIAGLGDWAATRYALRDVRKELPARRVAGGAILLLALIGLVQIPARSALLRTEEGLLLHTVATNPGHVESWITLGAEYAGKGETAKAYRCLREAIRRDPMTPQAHMNLANLYQLGGQLDSAIVAYRTELSIDPNEDEARINLADVLIEKGEESEARELYRAVIARNPDFRERIPERARVLIDASLDERQRIAWPERERGLRIGAGIIRAYIGVMEDGLPDGSRATAAELDQLRGLLVETEIFLGRYDRAREACAAAPGGTAHARALCLLAGLPGDPESSVAGLRSIWAAAPDEAATCVRIASFYQGTGRGGMAIPFWRALLRAGRTEPDQLNHIAAEILRDTSRATGASEARAIWELLLEERPDYPFSLLNLGGIAFTAGDKTRCRSCWERFLSLYPDRPEAADVRSKLATL
jgi:protein O-mannosyl-transferase